MNNFFSDDTLFPVNVSRVTNTGRDIRISFADTKLAVPAPSLLRIGFLVAHMLNFSKLGLLYAPLGEEDAIFHAQKLIKTYIDKPSKNMFRSFGVIKDSISFDKGTGLLSVSQLNKQFAWVYLYRYNMILPAALENSDLWHES